MRASSSTRSPASATGASRSSIPPAVTSPWGPTTARCSSPTTARSTTSASCAPSSSRSGTPSTPSCDTEVVLHAYLEWGTDCFARFNGMWALAVLDLRDADGRVPRLVLARDHYGIKPLYYARSSSGRVLFASEAKAVLADPELETSPDRQWLYDYLLHGLHDHKPQTAFAGVRALAAATWAVVDADGVHEQTYWTPTLSTDAPSDPAEFRRRFERSVERRLVADVPAGTCLSGGIDSSSIVGMASGLLTAHVPDAVSLGRSPQDVLHRLRRRSHRRAGVHGRRPRRGRRRARLRRADVGALPRGARSSRLAPGRTHRVDRSVRAVVRDAVGAAEGDRAAQRSGRRRAARRLRPLPVRLPARAAQAPEVRPVHARGVGVARRAEAAREAPAGRSPPGAADQAPVATGALRGPRAPEVPTLRRTT